MKKITDTDLIGYICLAVPILYYLVYFITTVLLDTYIEGSNLSVVYKNINIIKIAPYVLYLFYLMFILGCNKKSLGIFFIILIGLNMIIQLVYTVFIRIDEKLFYIFPHIVLSFILIFFSMYMHRKEIHQRNELRN